MGNVSTANVPENQDTSTVIVTLGFDVGVSHQEHRQDDGDNIPARENQSRTGLVSVASAQDGVRT